MTTLFVRHRVQDYARWRQAYDSSTAIQSLGGASARTVYRSDGDPPDVTVTHDFPSIDEARAFAEGAELREAMGKAGVLGVPTIWFASKAE